MTDEKLPPKPIYVYVLTDPRYPDDVRYVGVTNNPKIRLQSHIDSCKRHNNHRTCWIKSLLNNNVKPIMTIIDETNDENWEQCEIEWIAYYRSLGCRLVNSTNGGGGIRGHSFTQEHRRKISVGNLGRKCSAETRQKLSLSNTGKRHSQETRQKLSDIQRGKKLSEEHRHKISKGLLGRKQTEYVRRMVSEAQRTPILQYDKFGHFIRQWDSMTIAEKELGVNQGHISDCCRYKRKSAGGYIWRYADDPLLGEMPKQLSLDFE